MHDTQPGSSSTRLQRDTQSTWMVPWALWRSEQEEKPEQGAGTGWHAGVRLDRQREAHFLFPLLCHKFKESFEDALRRLQSEISLSKGFLPEQTALLVMPPEDLFPLLYADDTPTCWELEPSLVLSSMAPICAAGNPS